MDTRKHTRHILRPTASMVESYIAASGSGGWRRFAQSAALAAAALIALAACGPSDDDVAKPDAPAPRIPPGAPAPDVAHVGDGGAVRLRVVDAPAPLPVGKLHAWEVEVADSMGRPFANAGVVVRGRMPAHRHGLGARPEVTELEAPGRYRIDGLLFQMPGAWELWVDVSPGQVAPERVTVPFTVADPTAYPRWSGDQVALLAGMHVERLGEPPPDPSNPWADDERAAALGHALFFDQGLSADGTVSCATCHQPERFFTDGLRRSQGVHGGITPRHAPSVVGAAWSRWQFWDGRKDSLWAQAIAPWESATEHGLERKELARRILDRHGQAFTAVFGAPPRSAATEIVVHAAKAIAAYERRLRPAAGRFEAYVAALQAGDRRAAEEALSREEARGLAIFIGRGRCIQCHGGPRLTFDGFHNTGLPVPPEPAGDPHAQAQWLADLSDDGRAAGLRALGDDPFRCDGPHGAPEPEACGHLRFLDLASDDAAAAFKAPSLRGVADTAPYMHDGRFSSLEAVVAHYVAAPRAQHGRSDLLPFAANAQDIADLVGFLQVLEGRAQAAPRWLRAPNPIAAQHSAGDGAARMLTPFGP